MWQPEAELKIHHNNKGCGHDAKNVKQPS